MFNGTLNYRKYNTLELEPLIKQAMLAHGWPRDVIPPSIEFGISDIHRCGKGKEYGYTAGDGAVLLYDYRSRGTEPIKIKYSDFDASSTDMTPEERNEADRKDQLAKQEHLEARQKATAQADTFFNSLSSCAVATEYTNRKQIKLLKGVRNNGSDLIIPLKDANGQLRSLQTITENGDKLFAKGCEVDGHFHIIDDQAIQDSVIICEGYATAVSIQMATGMVTVAAFSASNLASVIQAIQSKHPDIQVLIAGDDDWHNKDGSLRKESENAGRKYGLGTAELYSCKVVFPDVRGKFMDEAKKKPMTDFNDVHVRFGIDEVKRQLLALTASTESTARCLEPLDNTEFEKDRKTSQPYRKPPQVEEPLPLRKPLPASPEFPLEALGDELSKAVLAIHDKIQSPIPLCVQSVLSCVSLVVQPHINIQLPYGQLRPTVLYFVTVGDTGERKDSTDSEAIKEIRAYEKKMQQKHRDAQHTYKIAKDTWNIENENILRDKKISLKEKESNLKKLGLPPLPPRTPVLIAPEPTLEGIHKHFITGLPSLGLFSTEGGQFIGGFGMSSDNMLKTSTGLSNMWDNKPITRMRGGDGTMTLYEKKLSIHLMLQSGIHEKLLSNPELQQQGLLSRMLCSYPKSLIGTRFSKKLMDCTHSNLCQYHNTIRKLLEIPFPFAIDNDGRETDELAPKVVVFTKDAKTAFYDFSDEIEKQMQPGGRFFTIKGFASKAAEHACRLAANLAFFENPKIESINETYFERGKHIALYYAEEALRLFGNAAIPPAIFLAERLLIWLKDTWKEDYVSLVDTYKNLSWVGNAKAAREILTTLEQHGWVEKQREPKAVKGIQRKEVWLVRRKFLTTEYLTCETSATFGDLQCTFGAGKENTVLPETKTKQRFEDIELSTCGTFGTCGGDISQNFDNEDKKSPIDQDVAAVAGLYSENAKIDEIEYEEGEI